MNAPESERLAVLQMVGGGQVSVEEGARLLGSLGSGNRSAGLETPEKVQHSSPRWFRVRVSDTHTDRTRVSVVLPYALVRWGLSLGAHFAPEVDEINLQELAELLENGEIGKLIDVIDEEDGEHVEIFLE